MNTVGHYENFPVASLLLPAHLRPAVVAIYHFARFADDLADEGDAERPQREHALHQLRVELRDTATAETPQVRALTPWIATHGLPIGALDDLLSAFLQDLRVSRYASRADIEDYCTRSANPIGRLLLHLFGVATPDRLELSDRICTALQRLNFLQDCASDWARGRLYLPARTLQTHGIDEQAVAEAVRRGRACAALRAAIADETDIALAGLERGRPLIHRVPLRLGLELRAVLAGGRRVAERIARGGYDPFATRTRLRASDAPALLRLSLRPPKLH